VTRYRLVVEYNGAGFAGFQKLSRKRTVQGELERVYERLCGHKVRVLGAGRTDTGVHATGQVVAFDSTNPRTGEQVVQAGNIMLPPDIRVVSAEIVAPDFHPRFSARSRTYRYLIVNGPPDPILSGLAWVVPGRLDLEAMRAAAEHLLGKHDFSAFTSRPEGQRRERTLLQLELGQSETAPGPPPLDRLGPFVWVEARADSFMRRMVRFMVGALVRVGSGEWEPDQVRRALQARQSTHMPLAPAAGLYLVKVDY
jgi:tRNA pseudouridine38-40 synthase